MSESTYFLDLSYSNAIRIINNRLNYMDTLLRTFPQTGSSVLKSGSVSTYDDREYLVYEESLESSGNTAQTLNPTQVYGSTTWNSSSISASYKKYSTGKFELDVTLTLNGAMTNSGEGDGQNYWYKRLIPLTLVKNIKTDSLPVITSIDNAAANFNIISRNGVPCLDINKSQRNSAGSISMSNIHVYITGSYTLPE